MKISTGILMVILICIACKQNVNNVNSTEMISKSADTLHSGKKPNRNFTGDSLIRIYNPKLGQVIHSPVKLEGEAKGMWYFEGDFPVELIDDDSVTIAKAVASADSNWMTEKFVPFSANIEFTTDKKSGYIVFMRDNASGLPRHDRSFYLPVHFKD